MVLEGPARWHFVTVRDEERGALEAPALMTCGWGMVPVTAQIGATARQTSLFPKDGRYILPAKARVRNAEGLKLNDGVLNTRPGGHPVQVRRILRAALRRLEAWRSTAHRSAREDDGHDHLRGLTVTSTAPRQRVRPAALRRRACRVAVIGLTALLVAALIVEGRSVLLFRAVAPWSSPARIHYCGRDYHRGGDVSAVAAEDVVGTTPFQQLTRGPLGQPVYGHPASPQRGAAGVPCAMVLYMHQGSGYRSYALSGGP